MKDGSEERKTLEHLHFEISAIFQFSECLKQNLMISDSFYIVLSEKEGVLICFIMRGSEWHVPLRVLLNFFAASSIYIFRYFLAK